MPKPRPRSEFLRRAVRALTISAPYALAGHFDDTLAHCVEASVCGAAALQRLRIKARAVPCVLAGHHGPRSVHLSVGLDARDIYARLSTKEGPLPPYDQWVADKCSLPPPGGFTAHAVIEASFGGERALIDLTLAQLRTSHGVSCGAHMAWYGDGWPTLETEDGWVLWYEDSPHSAAINEVVRRYRDPGLAGDLSNLLDAAMRCGGDIDRFTIAMQSSQPEQYAVATARLRRMLALEAPRDR